MKCDYCDRPVRALTFCKAHYDRHRLGKPMDPPVRSYTNEMTLQERLDYYAPPGKPDECWVYTGATRKGYGFIWIGDGEQKAAHVLSWELANGESADGRIVRHKCDNRPCVNPAHLEIGTVADNIADKVARGRQPKGESHGLTTLTESQVIEILRLYSTGAWSQSRLAKKFNTSQSTVSNIILGKTWSHLRK